MSVDLEDIGWANSHYTFENGDGTRYTMHLMPHVHGGTLVCVNDQSMWLAFNHAQYEPPFEIKFLCGHENPFTKRAIEQIMVIHKERVIAAAVKE